MKEHADALAEGTYCQTLGSIAPMVHVAVPGMYVMEHLAPASRHPSLLLEMEYALHSKVWSRPMGWSTRDEEWPAHLMQRTGLSVPGFMKDVWNTCMTHGDCTVSNAMRRADLELVIGDPVHPRLHVARNAEADMGRLLQSAAGWESVAYGDEPVEWEMPMFWRDTTTKRRALWWCGATARRILVDWGSRGQLTPEVRSWCETTERRCFSEADV